MRQLIAASFSLVSLLLCVGLCVLWARSCWRVDTFWENDDFALYSIRGSVVYRSPRFAMLIDGDPEDIPPLVVRRVPFYGPAAALALPPAAWLACAARRTRSTRRARRGLCHACGYDLRASPDRCPECGALATAASRNSGRNSTGAS